MSLSENSKLDPRQSRVKPCQAPSQTAIPTKRACSENTETQFQPSGHGKIVEYEYTTQCGNRNRIVALAARLPGQSEGRGAPLAGHSAASRKRAVRESDNLAVQILRRDHQGLPDNRTARVRAVDAAIIRALDSRNLFSVHDVRQVLANASAGHDWVKDEEVSEESNRIIRRCSRRGWIKPRARYPGQWETTPRYYLRPNGELKRSEDRKQ